jgi:PD-(D/E)XK endonuclease
VRDTTRLGDLAELEVTVALVRAGKRVLRPISSGCRYDLVIDDGDGRFIRIQCKSGVLHSGRITFRTYSMNASNPGRTYHGDVDAFGVYCAETGVAYLVPMTAIENCSTMASLRVGPSANGQRAGVRLASDFRIGG